MTATYKIVAHEARGWQTSNRIGSYSLWQLADDPNGKAKHIMGARSLGMLQDKMDAAGITTAQLVNAQRFPLKTADERAAIKQAKLDKERTRQHHCQVCARAIMDNTGLIAKHGYTIPRGWHEQTASCAGAGHVAYEKGRDVLPHVIASIDTFIRSTEERIEKVQKDEARLFERPRHSFSGRKEEPKEIPMSSPTYPLRKEEVLRELKSDISIARRERRHYQKRYDDWKPMEAAQ